MWILRYFLCSSPLGKFVTILMDSLSLNSLREHSVVIFFKSNYWILGDNSISFNLIFCYWPSKNKNHGHFINDVIMLSYLKIFQNCFSAWGPLFWKHNVFFPSIIKKNMYYVLIYTTFIVTHFILNKLCGVLFTIFMVSVWKIGSKAWQLNYFCSTPIFLW